MPVALFYFCRRLFICRSVKIMPTLNRSVVQKRLGTPALGFSAQLTCTFLCAFAHVLVGLWICCLSIYLQPKSLMYNLSITDICCNIHGIPTSKYIILKICPLLLNSLRHYQDFCCDFQMSQMAFFTPVSFQDLSRRVRCQSGTILSPSVHLEY